MSDVKDRSVVNIDDYRTRGFEETLTWFQLYMLKSSSLYVTEYMIVVDAGGAFTFAPVAEIFRSNKDGSDDIAYYEYDAEQDAWFLTVVEVYSPGEFEYREGNGEKGYIERVLMPHYGKRGIARLDGVSQPDD